MGFKVVYSNEVAAKAAAIKANIDTSATVAELIGAGIVSKEKVLLMAQLSIEKVDNEFGIHATTCFGTAYGFYELCLSDAIENILKRKPRDIAWAITAMDDTKGTYYVKENMSPVSSIYRREVGFERRVEVLDEIELDILWFLSKDTMSDPRGLITKTFAKAGC